jgi:dipicolinate synthase subunit A
MNKASIGTVAFIGGDLRQLYAADTLMAEGYEGKFCGLDTYRTPTELSALREIKALLFPVPVMKGDKINAPLSDMKMTAEELRSLPDGSGFSVAAGGLFPDEIRNLLIGKGYRVFDLCEDETFNYLNAVPTAEGAIALAINHTGVTLDGSSQLIIGYGRIGRCLSRRLKALGGNVTVCARSEKSRAEARAEGMTAIDYPLLPSVCRSAQAIFNTVPDKVINEAELSVIPADTPVIELASRPGGIDTAAALRCGTRIISALSLPGRVAPVTAGRIIADRLLSYLSEAKV